MTLVIATRRLIWRWSRSRDFEAAATVPARNERPRSRRLVLIAVGIALRWPSCGARNGSRHSRRHQPIIASPVPKRWRKEVAQILITDEQIITIHSQPYKMIGGGYWLGLPFSIILASVIFALAALLVRLTALGVLLESVGVNPEASRLAGVRARSITWTVYIMCAVLAVWPAMITSMHGRRPERHRALSRSTPSSQWSSAVPARR